MAKTPADNIYNIQKAMEELERTSGKFEDTMDSLAKSPTWGIISRMSSGIFPNFWSVQNKMRAITVIFQQYYKRQEKAAKDHAEAMAAYADLEKMERIMDKSGVKKLFDAKSVYQSGAKKGQFNLTKAQYVSLSKKIAGFSKIEEDVLGGKKPKNIDDRREVLKAVKGFIQPQMDELNLRKIQSEKASKFRKNFRDQMKIYGMDADDDSKDKFRKFLLEKKIKISNFFKAIGPWLKATLPIMLAFGKALLIGMLVFTGLMLIFRTALPMFKYIFTEIEIIQDWFSWFGTWIVFAFEGLGKILMGMFTGDFAMVLEGLIQLMVSAVVVSLMLAVTILGTAIAALGSLILGGIYDAVRDIEENGIKSFEALNGILKAIGQVMLVAGLIGVAVVWFTSGAWILTLGQWIALAIGGAILSNAKEFVNMGGRALDVLGFHAGGVVNSDMQLVGERGAELVSLPRGSRVHSNADSKRMVASSGGNTINVHVNGRVGASDAEIRDIANKVAREINLRMSRTGSGVNNF